MGKLGWTDVGVKAGHLRLGSFTRVHWRGPGLEVREFMNLTEKEITSPFLLTFSISCYYEQGDDGILESGTWSPVETADFFTSFIFLANISKYRFHSSQL